MQNIWLAAAKSGEIYKAALHQFEPATKFSENGADEKKRVFFLGDSAARGLDTSMKVVAEELVHIGST